MPQPKETFMKKLTTSVAVNPKNQAHTIFSPPTKEEPNMLKKSYIKSKQTSYNQQLIKIVAEEGLTTNNEANRIYSDDLGQSKGCAVCYFLVKSNQFAPVDNFKTMLFQLNETHGLPPGTEPLEAWQYKPIDGLWSLALERDPDVMKKGKDEYKPDLYEQEDRLNSTLLLLYDSKDVKGFPITQFTQTAGSPINDYKTENIEASKLKGVVANNNIINLSRNILKPKFSAITGNAIHTVGVVAISKSGCFEGPDYTAAIKKLLQEDKIQYPFVAHIMRLATARDFLRIDFLQQQLSYEECLKNYKTQDPHCCLRRMATWGEREDIEYLHQCVKDLDINAVSPKTGDSALHHAASRGKRGVFIMKALLLYGAKPDLINKKNETPATIAEKNGINIHTLLNGEYEEKISKSRLLTQVEEEQKKLQLDSEYGQYFNNDFHSSLVNSLRLE